MYILSITLYDFYYGTTTKPHYYTHLKFSEPYKEELLYGFLEYFGLFFSLSIEAISSLIPINLYL